MDSDFGGFLFKTQEQFEALDEHELDAYVLRSTDFKSWQDMLEEAHAHAVEKSLGL